MRLLGVPGVFAPTGSFEFLVDHFGLGPAGIRAAVHEVIARAPSPTVTDPLVLAVDQGTTNTKALVLGAGRRRAGIVVGPGRHRVPATGVGAERCGGDLGFGPAGDRPSVWAGSPAARWPLDRDLQPARVGRGVGTGERNGPRPGRQLAVRAHGGHVRRAARCRARGAGEGIAPASLSTRCSRRARWRGCSTAIADGRRRAADGEICLGTVDSWLLWNLTAGATFATDLTNASRTLLFDLSPSRVGR